MFSGDAAQASEPDEEAQLLQWLSPAAEATGNGPAPAPAPVPLQQVVEVGAFPFWTPLSALRAL